MGHLFDVTERATGAPPVQYHAAGFFEQRLPAGSSVRLPADDSYECIYVVSGRAAMDAGLHATRMLQEGDTVLSPPSVIPRLRAIRDAVLRYCYIQPSDDLETNIIPKLVGLQ